MIMLLRVPMTAIGSAGAAITGRGRPTLRTAAVAATMDENHRRTHCCRVARIFRLRNGHALKRTRKMPVRVGEAR